MAQARAKRVEVRKIVTQIEVGRMPAPRLAPSDQFVDRGVAVDVTQPVAAADTETWYVFG
jgi:hypothetical protein